MWWLLVACQSDPLASVGFEPPPPPEVPAAATPDPAIPTTPPMSGENIADGGVIEPAPAEGATAAAEPPKPPPAEFNPISIPQGPRENGGVKWEGVSKKSGGGTFRPADGSREYEENFGKN